MSHWMKILIGCGIGIVIGTISGIVTGLAGLPGWLLGAITGLTAPLIHIAIQQYNRP